MPPAAPLAPPPAPQAEPRPTALRRCARPPSDRSAHPPRPRTPSTRPARLLAVTAAALALLLSGCSAWAPDVVERSHDLTSGESGDVGPVRIRNALIASTGRGEPGVVSALVTNTSDRQVLVSVLVGEDPREVGRIEVGAGRSVALGRTIDDADDEALRSPSLESVRRAGPEPGWVQISRVREQPGKTTPLTFAVGDEELTLEALILRPCWHLADLRARGTAAPSAATPSAAAAAAAAAPSGGSPPPDPTAGLDAGVCAEAPEPSSTS